MTTLYAQPYNIDAQGFYFKTAEEFDTKAKDNRDRFDQPVEEYEVQFIEGDEVDCELAKAIGISQANYADYLECIDKWDEWEKLRVIVAIAYCDHEFDPERGAACYKVDVFEEDSLRDLAERYVEDGIFGDIPEQLEHYINYDAIARDLEMSCFEVAIAGRRFVCEAY